MINHRLRTCVVAAALCGFGAGVHAQDVDLGRITVKGEGMREADRSFTVNTIGRDEIANRRWENPLSIILEAPGVEIRAIQSGSVADNIMMRGMSSGGHGGDVGLSLDGVSLNETEGHADGYADTNVIIPLEINSFSIYKGPSSPLYGNFARGGVMAIETRKGGEYTDIHLSAGSYDTYDAQVAFGHQVDMPFGPLQLNGAVQGYESENWRDNGRFTKMNAALRGSYMIGDRSEIALSLRGHGARSQGVGNISAEQFEEGEDARRRQSPFAATQNDGADKDYNSQRIDFNHLLTDNLKLLTWYYQTKMFLVRWEANTAAGGPAPFLPDQTPYAAQVERSHDRSVQAVGASLNGIHDIGGIASNWVFGAEYYDEDTHENQWDTYARNRAIFDGNQFVSERKTRDNDFTTTTTSIFGQMDLDVHRLFRPTLGFRYDDVDQTGTVVNPSASTTQAYDQSYSAVTPKVGVRSAIHDRWELRASYAQGFQTPSIAQRQIDDLDPVKFTQYEFGVSGMPTSEIALDLVYFVLNSSDEIMTDPTLPSGSPVTNYGESERSGIEGQIRYFPDALPNFELSTGFGFFDTEVKRNSNPTLEGNELIRVPQHIANVTAAYAPPSGVGARLRYRTIGDQWLEATNQGKYDGYDILDASIFYTVPSGNGGYTRWYLDVNNATDEAYASNVGGNTAGPNSYNPRPPRNFMVGVIMSM